MLLAPAACVIVFRNREQRHCWRALVESARRIAGAILDSSADGSACFAKFRARSLTSRHAPMLDSSWDNSCIFLGSVCAFSSVCTVLKLLPEISDFALLRPMHSEGWSNAVYFRSIFRVFRLKRKWAHTWQCYCPQWQRTTDDTQRVFEAHGQPYRGLGLYDVLPLVGAIRVLLTGLVGTRKFRGFVVQHTEDPDASAVAL